jgi:hypothetical protein
LHGFTCPPFTQAFLTIPDTRKHQHSFTNSAKNIQRVQNGHNKNGTTGTCEKMAKRLLQIQNLNRQITIFLEIRLRSALVQKLMIPATTVEQNSLFKQQIIQQCD